ncbi:MAG: prolipoprotein diacylglyceryl transferase [Rhodobiaceae bacterium]|nr:prolipoprotein diacylglyceryl transferase [Rhodobiaceae bacterium]
MLFPDIDPIIFQIGPVTLRWYALAYMVGLIGGWYYLLSLAPNTSIQQSYHKEEPSQLDDLLLWLTLGTILGGRLGYILFYNLGFYLDNPRQIFAVWEGGMAFHGGLLGVTIAALLYARKLNINPLILGDLIAAAAPIGLFFGRIANFINSELWGRQTEFALGVVFPNGGPLPRHPSQLYEAFSEGLLLFIVLAYLCRSTNALQKPGLIMGIFIAGYGLSRMIVEQFFREPDAHIGYLVVGTTMGFWLSVPMLIAGLSFVYLANQKKP